MKIKTDNIILQNGDCLQELKKIKDCSVDLILTDLPYGQTHNKWDTVIPLDLLWSEYKRIIKNNGAIILFGNGMFTAQLMLSNPKMWRYNLIWEKTQPTGFLNSKKMPLRCHEDICVFYKKPPTYNPQKSIGHPRKTSSQHHKRNCKKTDNYGMYSFSSYDSTERYPKSIWKFAKDSQKSALHPTQKPVALLEELIKTYTNENDLVVDSCMGSGSTGVACINTNRRFIGIELDDKIFQIAKKRIEDAKK